MHICLLVSGILDHTPYGEEKFTDSLANWLSGHDYEVTVVARGGMLRTKSRYYSNKPVEHSIKKGFEAKDKANNHRYFSYAFRIVMSFLFIINILQINSKRPIDIIHAQDTGYAGLAAVISARLLKLPVIVSSHGIRHKSFELNLPKILKKIGCSKFEYYLDIFTIKYSDRIIAVNPYVKVYFESLTRRSIDFFPIPIDVKEFTFTERQRKIIRGEFGIEENNLLIGFIGRLSNEKNIDMLLYSFADISKENPELKLIIVGDGRMKDHLERIAKENAIGDRVIFSGLRYDIARILCSLDIFVLPSHTEGLSTSLLESMACERAIICSDIPANRQLVQHKKEALLVDPNNKDEFKQALRELCKNQSLRSELGYNAKKKSSLFDKEVIFPILAQYYDITKKEYL